MLLAPRTKEEFVRGISTLPLHQRRVVILAGRHLNEGSRNIAIRHHEEWEKHGAVTVLIPASWTPHGFWHEMKQIAKQIKKTPRKLSRIANQKARGVPFDEDLIHLLERNRVTAPVVNLHGNPSGFDTGRLVVFIQKKAPEGIHHAIENLPLSKTFMVAVEDDEESLAQHPREVLVEYKFLGKPKEDGKIDDRQDVQHGQLSLSYLTKEVITAKSLEHFRKIHAAKFNALIRELAEAQE